MEEKKKETSDISDLLLDYKPKGDVYRKDDIFNEKADKKAGIFLSLSPYKEEVDPGKYYDVIDDNNDSLRSYYGLRTNDAPIQYLIDEVYLAGYNQLKIVCIQTPKTEGTFDKLKAFINAYIAFRQWNIKAEVEAIEYGANDEKIQDKNLYYGFYKELNEKVSGLDAFYVDYTGGLRDMSFLMVVAIRFLEFKGIRCEKVIYSDWHKTPGQLKSLNQVYGLFQFINGMNEFVSSGTSRQLDDMFEEKNNLITAIHKFSHATSVGDMTSFDDRLAELKEALKNKEDTHDLNSLMVDSMKDVIEKKIFGENQEIDYYRLIDWCIENKMYQQAATLYIEKVPVAYWQKGILSDGVIPLSSGKSEASSREAKTFYTDLPEMLAKDRDLINFENQIKAISPPGDSKHYDSHIFKDKIRSKLANYEEQYNRLEEILNRCFQEYQNADKEFKPLGEEHREYVIKFKTVESFWNTVTGKNAPWLPHYIYSGKALEKNDQESDKARVMSYISLAYKNADKAPKTNDDKQLCILLAFYLAIKMLRNKMSHAAEEITDDENTVISQLEEFFSGSLEDEKEIKVSLKEEDIKKLLEQAMKYTKAAKPFYKK